MHRIVRFLLGLLAVSLSASAIASEGQVETTWRLLDYIAVDYSGAVHDGRISSGAEYAEMREFASTVAVQLGSLEPRPAKAALVQQGHALEQAIAGKQAPAQVAALARNMGANLLAAYPVPLAPTKAPDIQRGTALYQSNCSSCHGLSGDGRGPNAAKLNPPPIAFTDRQRAGQRSTFALEQVISQGLDGTAMQSFADLPEQDRWALAFRVGMFAYPAEMVAEGKRIWNADAAVRRQIPDLKTLVGITPQSLGKQIGDARAAAVMAYLRSDPSAVQQGNASSLELTRSRLAESLAAYKAGDSEGAKRLALSAYLDGFEPVEPVLSARDSSLMREIEGGMGELRSRIAQRQPISSVEQQVQTLDALFARADQTLTASPAGTLSTFLSALTILLREGVEALLIVVAMIAFVKKSGRTDALPYIHAGWLTALVAGLLTWFAATAFLSISGASRELTEGFGGIFAAVILVSVGIWMHGKSKADTWQRYIRERMSRAMNKRSIWFLFGLAFIVVYREVFETILFYVAMWTEGSNAGVIAGAGAGAAVLAGIAWAMVRYSVRLPIAEFFRYSSILIAVLAVVLAGKGIAAIQEAGLLAVSPVEGVPQVDLIGLHPSAQVIFAQLAVLLVIIGGFWLDGRVRASSND